jgi:hypothetical protein
MYRHSARLTRVPKGTILSLLPLPLTRKQASSRSMLSTVRPTSSDSLMPVSRSMRTITWLRKPTGVLVSSSPSRLSIYFSPNVAITLSGTLGSVSLAIGLWSM